MNNYEGEYTRWFFDEEFLVSEKVYSERTYAIVAYDPDEKSFYGAIIADGSIYYDVEYDTEAKTQDDLDRFVYGSGAFKELYDETHWEDQYVLNHGRNKLKEDKGTRTMTKYRVYNSFETVGVPAAVETPDPTAAETYAEALRGNIVTIVMSFDVTERSGVGYGPENDAWETAAELSAGSRTYTREAAEFIADKAVVIDEIETDMGVTTESSSAEDTTTYKGYAIGVSHDDTMENPREYEANIGKMFLAHRRYDVANETPYDVDSFGSWRDVEAEIKDEHPGAVVLPVFMFDHGDVQLSTKPFGDRFDSGQLGVIYATPAAYEKAVGSAGSEEAIAKELRAEVDAYGRYLNGESYVAAIFDSTGEMIDSLGNIDSEEEALRWAKAEIDNIVSDIGEGQEGVRMKLNAATDKKIEEAIDRLVEASEWPNKLKKGRFTKYCKGQGFEGPGKGCADKALKSKDKSVRGMASFYLNTVKP